MKQHKRITLSWRLLFKGIGALIVVFILVCVIFTVVDEYLPSNLALRACNLGALGRFYDKYPAPGGYSLGHRPETTVTSTLPTGYHIEAQVIITTGGFKGDLDDYPIRHYTANYSCTAISHGNVFQKEQWDAQITHYTAPVLIK